MRGYFTYINLYQVCIILGVYPTKETKPHGVINPRGTHVKRIQWSYPRQQGLGSLLLFSALPLCLSLWLPSHIHVHGFCWSGYTIFTSSPHMSVLRLLDRGVVGIVVQNGHTTEPTKLLVDVRKQGRRSGDGIETLGGTRVWRWKSEGRPIIFQLRPPNPPTWYVEVNLTPHVCFSSMSATTLSRKYLLS